MAKTTTGTWEPTEKRWYTRFAINNLPDGSIILSKGQVLPYVRQNGLWKARSGDAGVEALQLPSALFLVLYVPDPPHPEVGDEVTQQQLRYLRPGTVVLDGDGNAAQAEQSGTGPIEFVGPTTRDSTDYEINSLSADDLWHNSTLPIKVLWIPPVEPAEDAPEVTE